MKTPVLERIYTMKESSKLTNEEIAERMYVSVSTVNRWMAGTIIPGVEQLEKLAEVLGGDISELFAAVGKQELIATQEIKYEGATAMIARYEAQIEAMKERETLCAAHYSADMCLMEEHYKRVASYLKDECSDLHRKNRELMDRAITAEKKADDADARCHDLYSKRHRVFWAMLAPLVIVIAGFIVCVISNLPQIGMGW